MPNQNQKNQNQDVIASNNTVASKLDTISSYLRLLVGPQKKYNSGLQVLQFAVPNIPSDSNTDPKTGYTVVDVYTILGRRAPVIYLLNEGPGTIFSRFTSVNSISGFLSAEKPVFEGETAEFHNVWQLRLRTPTAGTQYRFTEFRQQLTRQRDFLKGIPFVDNETLSPGQSVTENIVEGNPGPVPVAQKGLGRNAHTGFIVDDGPGNLNIFFSSGEKDALGNLIFTVEPVILIPNQILDLDKEDMFAIIITNPSAIASSIFRMAVH